LGEKPNSKTRAYYELRDALGAEGESGQGGCLICHLTLRAVTRYLDSLLYEMVNDLDVRQGIRQARGFCHEHAWQLREVGGGALGVAIIHRDVIGTVLKLLRQGEYRPGQQISLGRLQEALDVGRPAAATADLVRGLEPQQECPACRERSIMEDLYLSALLGHLDDEEIAPALRRSSGLCFPHFRRALQLVRDERTFRRLVDLQLASLDSLVGDLDEFIRKHDYRFQKEGFGDEGDAWLRAIAQVSGSRRAR